MCATAGHVGLYHDAARVTHCYRCKPDSEDDNTD